MSTRLLGVQIANGYSPESRVFAHLLAHTDAAALEPHLIYHRWQGDVLSGDRFQEAAGGTLGTDGLDFGWRSVASGRSLPSKARARLRFLAALPRALALARRVNPDVLYSSQQLWDCQAATYLARKLGRPQVIHLHYIIGPWLHKPVLERLLTCDHVVTISGFIREEALRHGVSPAKVTTIHNTVMSPPPLDPGTREAVRRDLRLAQDATLVGIVARLDPGKGQADTLQAFALAVKGRPDVHLLVIGDETPWHPGYGAQLRTLASNLGLTGRAHFLGPRSDVPRLLAALDVFVHPSRHEPFGLAVAEASAAGLPVVAYADGSLSEIVREGVTGLLTAPKDLEALARSLARLVEDPELARAQGRAGRSRMASEFQPALAGEAFAGLMERFHAPAPKGGPPRQAGSRPAPPQAGTVRDC